jgi:hypothetical protein
LVWRRRERSESREAARMTALVEVLFIEKNRAKGVWRGLKTRETPNTCGRMRREGALRYEERGRGGSRLMEIRESPKTRSLRMEERSMMPVVWMTTNSEVVDFKAMYRTESKQRQDEENQVEKSEHELEGRAARWLMLTRKGLAVVGKDRLPRW